MRGAYTELALDQTVLDRDKLMAALAKEAEGRAAAGVGYGKDAFVAVAEHAVAAKDLLGLQLLLSDMPQRGIDALAFEAQLLLIAHVPGVAASAFSVVRAGSSIDFDIR